MNRDIRQSPLRLIDIPCRYRRHAGRGVNCWIRIAAVNKAGRINQSQITGGFGRCAEIVPALERILVWLAIRADSRVSVANDAVVDPAQMHAISEAEPRPNFKK